MPASSRRSCRDGADDRIGSGVWRARRGGKCGCARYYATVESRPYTVDLPEIYIADLERLADEAGMSPGEMLQALTKDLRGTTIGAGMVMATAHGVQPIITRRSFTAGGA